MPFVTFEFVVQGPPLSANTRKSRPAKHSKWREKIKQSALASWESDHRLGLTPTSSPVEMHIATYYTALAMDVDNILKDILDSLKGVVYNDDSQIDYLTSRRINLNKQADLELGSSVLFDAIDNNYLEFVHVELRWTESEDE